MMKKLNFKRIIGVLFIMIFPVVAFCQFVEYESAKDVIDVAVYFTTLAALAGIVLPVTQFLKTVFKVDGSSAQWLSWLVAFILSAFGWWMQYGIFADMQWYYILIYGLASGLIANGLFDFTIVNAILTMLTNLLTGNKKK